MSNIEKIDIPAELDRVIEEITSTDARQDQFRSMKALMLYQCSLLERIVMFIDAFMKVEPEK